MGRQDQRCKHSMFNLSFSFSILSLLCIFMQVIQGGEVLGAIRGRIWVKHPHVEKCALSSRPETMNVTSGFILCVDTLRLKGLLAQFKAS